MLLREQGRRLSRGLWLHSLGCAWLGCASEEAVEEPPPYASLPVIAGCQHESFTPCDPLELQCQASVFATIKCLRQMPDAVLPEIVVKTSAEQRAEFGTDSGVEPAELARLQAYESALVLLGLARPGELSLDNQTALFVDSTAAYYTHTTRVITLSAHEGDEPPDVDRATLTLAHEFVHALQDQDVGLDLIYDSSTSFDDYLGQDSLIEGEAEMLETFVSAAYWGFGESPDFRQHFLSWVADAEQDFADVSPWLAAPLYVPYSYGARYVYDLFEQGGMAAVRERLRNPLHSVLPIVLSDDQLQEPVVESFDALSAPGSLAGFELLLGDTLGSWVFGKFLQRVLGDGFSSQLMPSWRGDRLLVYGSQTASQVAALWTLRLADSAAAERLRRELQSGALHIPLRDHAFIARRDRDVTIGVSSDSLQLPDWSTSLDVAQETWGQAPNAARSPRPPRSPFAPRRPSLQR